MADAYDATTATYRGDVLTAFQQVEDDLATLRILAQADRTQHPPAAPASVAPIEASFGGD